MTRKEEITMLLWSIILLAVCILIAIIAYKYYFQQSDFIVHLSTEANEWAIIFYSALVGIVYCCYQIVFYITYKMLK